VRQSGDSAARDRKPFRRLIWADDLKIAAEQFFNILTLKLLKLNFNKDKLK
jgi:hypothetical protein